MSLINNVALPLVRHRGMPAAEAAEVAMGYLRDVGAMDAAHRFPAEIGGGVRKLVAVARALAMQPRYLILDEPTTSLDPISARQVDRLIQKLSRELGVTVVVVSHDLKSIFGVADEIVFLHKGKVRVRDARENIRTHADPALQAFLSGKPFEKERIGPWID
jgi:phospholipid/cholesterol/gamma-HCH transport system ATP-binding protein